MSLLKAVSRLCETKEIEMTSVEYNDIIHGRIDHGVNQLFRVTNQDLPIQPRESRWEEIQNNYTQGTAIIRMFEFANFKTLQFFINEMLTYQEKTDHHARITISHYTAEVQLQTQDVNDVTESDLQMAEFLDEIYKDTQFFSPV